MHYFYRLLLIVLAASVVGGCGLCRSTDCDLAGKERVTRVPYGRGPGQRFQKSLISWQEIKERHVVMQQHDYSCGAAALATMFQYYFEDDITEQEILHLLLKDMTDEEIRDREENGLSMDDLFQAAKKLGYQATVYALNADELKDLSAPVIVRLIDNDYKHFVVYRGAVEDQIWLADPIRGNVRMPAEEFAEQWSGPALILGKSGFGLPDAHLLAIPSRVLVRPELQAARRFLYTRP